MARGVPFYYSGFVGGLNTRDGAVEIGDDQARDLLNVQGTVAGAIRKRDGSTQLVATAAAMTSLFASEATGEFLLGQAGTKWYATTGSAPTDITGAATVTAAPWTGAEGSPSGGQGPVYLLNGTDTPLQWTGSGNVASWTASAGTLPNGTTMAWAANRMFVAGMAAGTTFGGTDDQNTVVWSKIRDPRNWDTTVTTTGSAGFVGIDPKDGDKIIAICTLGQYILVLKRRKAYLIYDLATGAYNKLSGRVGAVSARSVAEAPGGVFFLSDDGVYLATPQGVELVSDIIRPTVQSIAAPSKAAGYFFNNHYYLSHASTGSTNDTMLDFDTQLKSWWKHSLGMNQMVAWRPSTTLALYGAPAAASRIDRLFVSGVSTDPGGNFSAYWTTNWQSPIYFHRRRLNAPDTKKHLRGMRFEYTGKVKINLAVGFANTLVTIASFDATTGDPTFGGADTGTFGVDDGTIFGVGAITAQGKIAGRGGSSVSRAFSYQFASDATSASPWQVESYEAFIDPRTN